MKWIVENWYLIVAALAAVVAVGYGIYWFVKQPSATKIQNIKEWLKWAVTEAEKQLGSGTGQLKLRMVYNLAVEKFPWLLNVVTFETFSAWVDEALEWMRSQLLVNQNYKALVEGKEDANGVQ